MTENEEFPSLNEVLYRMNGTLMNTNKLLKENNEKIELLARVIHAQNKKKE